MTVLDELANMPARLRAAADQVEEARTRERNATEHRNRLVVSAVDAGMPYREIGRNAGVSQPHVVRILSHQDDLPAADIGPEPREVDTDSRESGAPRRAG